MDVAPNITGYDYTRGGTTFDYLAFDADYEFKVYFWTVDPVTGADVRLSTGAEFAHL